MHTMTPEEKACADHALDVWDRSQSRKDLTERDRVLGALQAYQRKATAIEMAKERGLSLDMFLAE